MEQIPQLEFPEQVLESLLQPQPTVVGIEGGPCSGKTTLVERLQGTAGDRKVVVLPEAATGHIAKLAEQGLTVPELAATDREGFLAFESDVLQTIISNIEQAREQYAGTDAIIVADRCDIGAYLTDEEYRTVLSRIDRGMPPMLELVDQLYYLPSVAIESPEKYEDLKTTNAARYETVEQAQATCRANLAAVKRHPELHTAWGSDFDHKLAFLVDAIMRPEEETEFALEYLDESVIIREVRQAWERGRFLSKSLLRQSYHNLGGVEFRLRQTTTERGEELYAWTVKEGEGITRRELQRRLTAEQYEILTTAPQLGQTLRKTRYEILRPQYEWDPREIRKWTIDHYDDPGLMRWQAEVEIHGTDYTETFPWDHYPQGTRTARPATVRARQLAEIALS